MAKEEKKKDKKEKKHHSKGEMNFGLQIVLFVIVVFILWLLTGGSKKEAPKSPLLVPKTQTEINN